MYLFLFFVFQVLSGTVAHALEFSGGDEVSETVKFVHMMDKFFDCLNVNNFLSGKKQRKCFQDLYRSADDFRFKVSSFEKKNIVVVHAFIQPLLVNYVYVFHYIVILYSG